MIAGVVRGQYPHLEEHIEQKKSIYERYAAGMAGLPVRMNPVPDGCVPNYWLSCVLIESEAMCEQSRGELSATYSSEAGKSCPTEILEAIAAMNAEGRPIWKPMHMHPMYKEHAFVTAGGVGLSGDTGVVGAADIAAWKPGLDGSVSADIFERGFCLPSDNKMTMEQVDRICEVVRECFG